MAARGSSLRLDDYCIIYTIQDEILLIVAVGPGHRRKVYRD